jgi:hypothetical protein
MGLTRCAHLALLGGLAKNSTTLWLCIFHFSINQVGTGLAHFVRWAREVTLRKPQPLCGCAFFISPL